MTRSPSTLKLYASDRKELQYFLGSVKNPLEYRSALGVKLKSQGLTAKKIAEQLGVTDKQVFVWCKKFKDNGVKGLKVRKPTGKPPVKGNKAKKIIPKLLEKDPQTFGFLKGRWVVRDIAKELKKEGVNLSFQHISLLLHDLGINLLSPKLLTQGSIKKKSQET